MLEIEVLANINIIFTSLDIINTNSGRGDRLRDSSSGEILLLKHCKQLLQLLFLLWVYYNYYFYCYYYFIFIVIIILFLLLLLLFLIMVIIIIIINTIVRTGYYHYYILIIIYYSKTCNKAEDLVIRSRIWLLIVNIVA